MITIVTCRHTTNTYGRHYDIEKVGNALQATLLAGFLLEYGLVKQYGEAFPSLREQWRENVELLHNTIPPIADVIEVTDDKTDCDICCIGRAIKIMANTYDLYAPPGFMPDTAYDAEFLFSRAGMNLSGVVDIDNYMPLRKTRKDAFQNITRANQVLGFLHNLVTGELDALRDKGWRTVSLPFIDEPPCPAITEMIISRQDAIQESIDRRRDLRRLKDDLRSQGSTHLRIVKMPPDDDIA